MEKSLKFKLLALLFLILHFVMGWLAFSVGFDHLVTYSKEDSEATGILLIGVLIIVLSVFGFYGTCRGQKKGISLLMHLFLAMSVLFWLLLFSIGVSFWAVAPEGEEVVFYDACMKTFISKRICEDSIAYISVLGLIVILEIGCVFLLYMYKREILKKLTP